MPLGDHILSYVNTEKLEMPLPIETQKCPVESKETLGKTHFAGSYLTVTGDNL